MKESELRKLAKCSICKGPTIAKGFLPMFYKLKVSHYALDLQALQRQTGLEMMLGGAAGLAQAMGPNEDMAQELGEEETISICMKCMTTHLSILYHALDDDS